MIDNSLFKVLFENMTSGAAIYEVKNDGLYGRDYIIKGFNKVSRELENLTLQEVIGKSLFDIRPTIDQYGLIEIFRKVWKTGKPAHFPSKQYIDKKYSNWYENQVFKLPTGEIVAVYNDITERELTNLELKEKNEMLTSMVENAPYGVFIIDQDAVYKQANKEACRQTGYSAEELSGKTIADIMPEIDSDVQMHMFSELKEKGFINANEHFITKSGEKRLWQINGVKINADTYMAFTKDITEEERLRNQIHKTAEEYQSLFDNAALGIGYFTTEGKVIWFNKVAASNMGGSPEDFRGKTFNDIFPENQATIYMKRLKSALNANESVSYEDEMDLPVGRVVFYSTYICIRNKNNEILGVQIISQDISEIKEAERALAESRAEYKLLFDEAPMGYQTLNAKGIILDVNKTWIDIFGYKKAEVLGTEIRKIICPEYFDILKTYIDELREAGKKTIELEAFKKNGERIYIRYHGRVVRDAKGNFIRSIGLIQDISAIKMLEKVNSEMEAQLRNQKKLESIGVLAGGVAHEINNPINGIMNYGQLILDTIGDEEECSEYAREIIHESQRIALIVKDLLQFSRHGKQVFKESDIEEIITHTVSLIRTIIIHDQIELTVEIEKNLPEVICKSQQIQQVLMNILTNARDALNDKFQGYNQKKAIELNCRSIYKDNSEWIQISIKDNGKGIPEALRDNIFDPFFTTKGRDMGTGLGLSISYGIMKDHKGNLYYETKADEFTVFFMELPVNRKRVPDLYLIRGEE